MCKNLDNANLVLLQVLIENVITQWNNGQYDEPSMMGAMGDLTNFMNGTLKQDD